MKKIISYCIVLTLLFSGFSFSASCTSVATEYINNEIFVMYKNGNCEVLELDSEKELLKKLSELKDNNNVLICQPNYAYYSTGISLNDEHISSQWALYNDGSFYMEEKNNKFPVFEELFGESRLPGQWTMPDFFNLPDGSFFGLSSKLEPQTVTAVSGIDINLNEALGSYNGGKRDVVVAVVDTGIDYNHKELEGKIWVNSKEIENNGIDDDSNGFIDDYYGWNFYNNSNTVYSGKDDDHGTHGAGTIIAASDNSVGISGIVNSDKVKVMSVKALGGYTGSGSTESIIKAILYAEKNGADICNLSLGTFTHDEALYQTIKNSNMLFVVAAGNNGKDIDSNLSYPASYELDNIITVANLNYNGTLNYSSNYGVKNVDIAAPGSYILSTTSNDSYSFMTGTSMSAPFVSAAAALLYSHYDNITLCNVKEIILNSATKVDSLKDMVKTGGMLNIGKALKYDLQTLSSDKWEEKTNYVYKGKAPVITAQTIISQGKTYLTVRFYDEDGDFELARYKEGEYKEADFIKGTSGEPIELRQSNTVNFIAEPGTYTFYALDKMGNETVKTVKVSERKLVETPDKKLPGYNKPGTPEDNKDMNYKKPSIPDDFFDSIFNDIFERFFGGFKW